MKRIQSQKSDSVFFGTVMVLMVFGIIMISSAGVIYSQVRFDDAYYFFKHQLFYGILPGLLIMYFTQKIDYHYWKKISFPFFLVSIIFLVLVFVPGLGAKIYGANRWVDFGFVSFQPSEMAKLALIIYLSSWLDSRGENKIKDFFEGFLPFLGILGLMGFLILKQPDLGTLGVLVAIAIAIFFISGAKFSHIISFISFGVLSLIVLVKLEPYRFNRILAFLDRGVDPQGIGYQINQALLAVGSGGFWGLGLGHSRQKFSYLPEPMGDSIFAIIGEELGLVGASILVILFLTLAFRGFRIAKQAPDNLGKLMAIGIVVWIIAQAFINISANLAIIPLTGIPMPFVSYGGTSLIFLLASVGILLNISKQSKI